MALSTANLVTGLLFGALFLPAFDLDRGAPGPMHKMIVAQSEKPRHSFQQNESIKKEPAHIPTPPVGSAHWKREAAERDAKDKALERTLRNICRGC